MISERQLQEVLIWILSVLILGLVAAIIYELLT
jgi:hypothetical protein